MKALASWRRGPRVAAFLDAPSPMARRPVPRGPRRNLDWIADALCAQTGGDLHVADAPSYATVAAARAICARCPVQDACLADALAYPAGRAGVYAGLTQRQRQRHAMGAGARS